MRWSSLAKLSLILLILLTLVLGGCHSPSGEIEVRVIVTQNFGNELMLDELVVVNNGSNAMDALRKVAKVEAKYGGGFVESINGVSSQYSESKISKDWFFNVNGMSANIGAMDYKLCDGDVEHWDFHDWGFHAFIPAIVGDFPQPFLGGFQGKSWPTVVLYEESLQKTAQDLVSGLEELGLENVCMAGPESSAYSKKRSNLILLGTEDFELISELNKNYEKLGFYIHFEDDKVMIFDSQGNKTQHESSCGLIQATQNPWNPKGVGACENVVWMISGTDKAQARTTANVLVNHYKELSYACGAIIADGKVIKVPQ